MQGAAIRMAPRTGATRPGPDPERSRAAPAEGARAGAADAAGPGPWPAAAGATVLVVEDNALNRRFFAEVLRLAGHRVAEAGDGPEALAAARARPPDLVLMDIDLPGFSGLEAVRRMRAEPTLATIPVLAVSAHVSPGTARRAQALGCRFLPKPVGAEALAGAVAALLAAEPSGGEGGCRAGS